VRIVYKLGFTEVDFAQLLFSADFYRFAERTFETWHQSHGLGLRRLITELDIGLPAVETRCRYLAPIRFEDEFAVTVSVRDLTDRGFFSDFEISLVDGDRLAAFGFLERRFMDMRTGRAMHGVPDEVERVYRAMADDVSLITFEARMQSHQRSK
jgi:acyl-CoA thioester hydrolase